VSAAVWAEPHLAEAHYDPHQRLRTVRVQRSDGASQPTPPSVRLVVWGVTDDDRREAERLARADVRIYRRHIAAVEQAETPMAAGGDPAAIAHGAEYDCTWAAYPADPE
jgi:hypothetical protein